ncbi:MAG TPA: VOC family protein [Gaiellaceae bacterium]|nr:VOC family protein [Gaiellaceae bacterium]
MRPEKLDHVALFVPDPDRVAATICARLPFRVIEREDDFVLVGRSPELGKITLFHAPAPRDRGALLHIGIGVPCAGEATSFDAGDGLAVELVPAPADGHVELRHVGLLVPDPGASADAWLAYGFEKASRIGTAERVQLDGAFVELHSGDPPATDRPLLNHVGLLVESLVEVTEYAAEQGFHVTREVDAENSKAIFVRGPDGVELEYIEHKPSFVLA